MAWEKVKLDTPDSTKAKKPFYNLMMFPYPSAEGLHVGNMYAFTGSDIYGRFKRMQGFDVFEPIGLDGFGIHSENYALKIGRHPMDHAAITQKNFYNQLHKIGSMYDWSRTVETYNPDYYRWTQWLFIQMFKHGLAYRGKAQVNWCPGCKTVLADEQVVDNSCERCGNAVKKRELEQWFFKITAYAEKLLQNSFSLDWANKVKVAQQAWIGKKQGINITYQVVDKLGKPLDREVVCFTTTPVNFAATFLVVAPEHPFVTDLVGKMGVGNPSQTALDKENIVRIGQYVDEIKKKTHQDRIIEGRKKTGIFSGLYALNHVTGDRIPIWISDFVLMGVGTGAIQACPGHDVRDFEFAMQFDIDIKRVVIGSDGDSSPISTREQVIEHGPGKMINSGFLDGLPFEEAMTKTMDYFEQKGWGKRVTTYHLRDWLISRQRYWGPPIPMIYCEKCANDGNSWFTTEESKKMSFPRKRESSLRAMDPRLRGGDKRVAGWYPIPEDQLPVILPRIEDYRPGDDGIAPLAKHKEFYETKCPSCGGKAVRETDVSDTFLDSSWYFLRYPSVNNVIPATEPGSSIQGEWTPDQVRGDKKGLLPWDPEITKRWLPVPMYTGGAEHSVLHLMYSRFVWMALRDWGYLDFSGEAGSRFAGDEPFTTFYAHGLVIKDGSKMSKSKGNVVNPDEYIVRYGVDALRLYLMFTGPFDQGGDFRDSAMEGMSRWVQKVWRMAQNIMSKHSMVSSATIKKSLHIAIKKVGEDIERRRYNTAISAMMELVNTVVDEGPPAGEAGGVMAVEDLKDFLKILAPFAPYMTEELYQMVNTSQYTFTKSSSIHFQPWPAYDEKLLVEDTVQIVVQVNGKLRDTVRLKTQDVRRKSDVEKAVKTSAKVAKYLEGKTVKKVIFVPGKLINFVV